MIPPKPNARFSFLLLFFRDRLFFFFFLLSGQGQTQQTGDAGRAHPGHCLRRSPRATCGPGGRRPGTSPLFADVLKLRSLGVLVMLFFPLGVCECVLFSLKSPVFCFYSFVTLFTIFSKWSKGL